MECATECVKEYTSCHKPYDDLSFFELHPDQCNSCGKKLHNAKMKKEVEKQEEEQLKRSVLPPISVLDWGVENLQSEIDDEEPMYMDHSRKARDNCHQLSLYFIGVQYQSKGTPPG